jgi:hemoglobin/transferrin/lactoferrin receptor protein
LRTEIYADYNAAIPNEELPPSEADKPHLYATDANGDPYCPSWWTLNLKAGFQLTNVVNLQAGVENILDIRYRPYSSGMVAPGRNFIVAVRANF